jgi:hypothetical protein
MVVGIQIRVQYSARYPPLPPLLQLNLFPSFSSLADNMMRGTQVRKNVPKLWTGE